MDASTTLPIELDAPLTIGEIKTAVEAHFAAHKQLLRAKLSVASTSTSAASTLFSSAETKSILHKVSESKFWTKPATAHSLHPIKQLPLLPVIVPSSKLYLALFPNSEHTLVNNSFDVLKNVHHAYDEVMKLTTLPPKAKSAIDKQKVTILGDTLTFTSNTLARLFVRSSESEVFMEMFMRENYYTTINIIRIFEFSILDLLKLAEKHQSSLVTPIETELAKWKSSSSYDSAFLEDFQPALLSSYKTVYNLTLSEAESSGIYPSEPLQRKHLEVQRAAVQDHLFLCGNHESCQKREFKPKSFGKCIKCKWTRYCSTTCQTEHWKIKHKGECGKPLNAEDADALFKGRRIVIGAEGDANTASSSSEAPK